LVGGGAARYHESVVTRKYPLDPLKRVRADKVDKQARTLARAVGEVEKAKAEAERRDRAKRDLERSLAEVATAERERLERGELSVADLARGAAFGIAGDMRRAAHERSLEEARVAQARASSEADLERQNLAVARADARVVDKHHDKWQTAIRAEAMAKDEENAEEAYLAKRERGRS
jgi:hypothetical protein